ncbi:HCLS1-associated protein X-1 [Mantella aurantiaca]
MSVFDLFRRFFEPPGMRDPFFGGMTLEDEDDDDDEEEDDFFPGHRFQSPFGGERPPFHDPFQDVFRDFNRLFSDFPRIPGAEPPAMTPEGSRGGSLRDSMLKIPDSRLPRGPPTPDPPTGGGAPRDRRGWPGDDVVQSGDPKQDKVLDSEVSSLGLDSILRPQRPPASSSFRSVSVSRVTRPDGTMEERRTVRDGQGNTTTTVTVTRGGEVISSENPDTPRNSVINPPDSSALLPPPSLPDLSDSQTVLSRILHRWFSGR